MYTRPSLIATVLALAIGLAISSAGAQSGASAPIKIGWLVALTGPSSTPGIGFDRGLKFTAEQINKAGGIGGRQIEIVTRDTQGDPTKAVNAALEMLNNEHVEFVVGPTNSGEALAVEPIVARNKIPHFIITNADPLIDPVKFPYAFRVAATMTKWTEAAHNYVLNILKAKHIGIIGDATGYGTLNVGMSEQMLQAAGITVAYKSLVEANQTDLTADMRKAKNAGTDALLVWSDAAGFHSRLLNARAELGWDVPIVGHPTLGAGAVKQLLAKPENWEKVYNVGYRCCSFDQEGKLPERTQKFVDDIGKTVRLDDIMLFFPPNTSDILQFIRIAVEKTGSSKAEDVKRVFESGDPLPGIFCNCTFSPTNHNGFPTSDVVMNRANSFRMGAYALAPGYGK